MADNILAKLQALLSKLRELIDDAVCEGCMTFKGTEPCEHCLRCQCCNKYAPDVNEDRLCGKCAV
jgi:hypothetical protein